MSQPTQTEIALEEFRKAGAPIEKAHRPYASKRMEGFNAEVYAAWIERWACNAASNFPIVNRCDGVGFLRNAAKDVPAIVVGIGPSLDDEILELKKAPRHAVIIATDAALRPLLRHGIKPDLVVNYDAKDAQATMWDSIDTTGMVLLASTCTSPFTLNAWKGPVMFFNMMQSDDEFASNILPAMFPYTGQLPNLGTVGNGAVFLAYQMGCSPIIGVGMDLCYRQANRLDDRPAERWEYRCSDYMFVQASGDFTEGRWEATENKVLYDNDARMKKTIDEEIKGKTYKTDECLKFYRGSLISTIGKFDIKFINCSGGVLTDLVKSMPLREALETKCYAALEPGRTILKHLPSVIVDGKAHWTLFEPDRLFIPNNPMALDPSTRKR